jgi:serine/threonine-protein kinase
MITDFGDYELLEEIGRGGQGVVYRARQKSLNRIVALKVIGPAHRATEAHVKRFRREAEAAARLEYPGIVPIHEVGERDGQCYFSMKFVEGGQLDEVVRRAPMSIREAAELIAKVAHTVHYAHEHGILHRDIKPGNILLDQNGEPHLTDFGLARLMETESTVTGTMDVLGTPSYMAPEQAAGHNEQLTAASDVYGLGAAFYQLLTGHPPFAGGTTYETFRMVLEQEPRQPRLWNRKVDRDLATICLKCLEKDPKRRYSSALALAEDLERWLRHQPILGRRTGVFTRGKKWLRRNPTMALLLVLSLAFVLVLRRPPQSVSILAEKSLAVLPLVNTGGDPNNEYFSDGLSEELIAVLAKVPALKVIGRSSSFLFKGTSDDSRTIGGKLGVTNLLEGSVRKEGTRVRIVAELINVADGRELWAETYDRELKDVFAVQSEIATAVANQLKIKLLGLPPQSDAAPLNENIAAYNALQQGVFYYSRGNEEGFRKAIEFYNEAIRLDPSYALAYAQLSIAWQRLAERFLGGDELVAAEGKARSAAQTALALPPNIPEAHWAMGTILEFVDHNYDEAVNQLQQADALAPGSGNAKAALAYLFFAQGRLPEAEEMGRKAQALDPLGLGLNLIRILIARQKYDEAEALLRRAIETRPKATTLHMQLTNIYLLKGKTTAALEEARLEPPGLWQDYALALAQQAQGDSARADAALQKFIEKNGEGAFFQVAIIYALRKEPDEMFAWLNRAYEGNDAGLSQLLTAPFIHNYRDDPRFAALCQRLNLPAPKSGE